MTTNLDSIIHAARTAARISHESNRPPPPSSSPPATPPGRLSRAAEEEESNEMTPFICPIHLREYNAAEHRPHTIMPCGHTVCRATCIRETRCPICRGRIMHHAPCRGLIDVISTISQPSSQAKPPIEENDFLRALQKHSREIEGIVLPRARWTSVEWAVFNELVNALKRHANVVTPVWIEAAGLHPHLASALKQKLGQIRHTVFNRKLLAWEHAPGLPLALE